MECNNSFNPSLKKHHQHYTEYNIIAQVATKALLPSEYTFSFLLNGDVMVTWSQHHKMIPWQIIIENKQTDRQTMPHQPLALAAS